ncbi:hypothetical protein CBR_g3692 [Chara braunii]|uniref:AAA+ ATPase domain-containing protein n=1 Tax=Chara braunii TaxID=69332 RepID=A0A388KG93_CHABU|nr:hypothetical protein CBR_g3692 [Chara braunii]|eukprot:GBG68993.1 hypothetical protein CBR_g3692 [Chara braunii]
MDRNYSVGTVLASAAAVVLTEAALRFLRFKPKPKPKLKGPTGAAAMAAAAAESRDPCPARRQLAALEIAEETAAALASPRCAPTSPVFRADSPGGFYTRSDGTLRKMRGTSSSSGSRGAVHAQLLAERKTSQEPESRSAGRDRRDQGEEGRTVEVQRGEGIDAGVAGYPPPPLAVSEAGQRDHEGGQREVLPLTPLSPRVGLDLNLGCDDDAAVVEDVFSKIADCLSPRADVAAAGTLAGAVRRGNDPRQLRRATSTLHDMTKSKILQNLLVRDQVEETFDSFPYYVGEDTKEALITSSFIHLKRASLSECINLKDFRASSSTILLCGPAESIVYMQKLAKAVANHYGANFLYVDTSTLLPSSQAYSRSSTRMRRTSFPSGFGKRGGDAVSGEERGRGVSSSASSVNLLSAGTEASAAGNEAAGEETKPKPRGMHRRCRSEAVLVGKENRHPASVMELEDWDIESLTASGLLMDERAQRRIIIEALFEVLEMPMNFGEPTVVLIRDPGDALFNDVSSCLFFKDKVERHEGPSVFFKTATETQSNSKRQKLQDVEGASGTQKEEACEDFDKLAKLVFPKKIAIQPPKEPEKMSEWRKQLDADIKCTLIEDNKNFLAAFLQENGVICQDVGKLSMTDIPLTQKDAEEIVGWAVTSYLMHTAVPDHHDGRLVLPFERLECGLKRFLARRRENDGAEAALRKSEVSEKTSTAKKSTDPATEKRTEAESAKARQGPSSTSSGERTLDTAKPSSEPEKKKTATTATSTTPAASTEPAKKPVTAAPKEPEPAADNEFEKKIRSEMIAPGRVGVSFDDIGALDKVKQTLRELVMLPLKRPEIFSRGKLMKPCKGILLFGPPGTGKTMLAKAVATEAGASFLNVSMSTITSKWFGEDEKNVRALFTLAAKVAPTIVFIDEVDSMLGRRTRVGEHEAMRKIKNEFMSHWDGLTSQEDVRVLILAATNRPFDLDDAIIRRFQRRKGGRKREDEEGEACLGRSKQRRQHEEQRGRGGTTKKRSSEGTMRMEERGIWNKRRKRDEREEDNNHGRRREFMEGGRGCREEVSKGRRTSHKGEEEVGTRGMRRSHKEEDVVRGGSGRLDKEEEVGGEVGGGHARGKQTSRRGGGGGGARGMRRWVEDA